MNFPMDIQPLVSFLSLQLGSVSWALRALRQLTFWCYNYCSGLAALLPLLCQLTNRSQLSSPSFSAPFFWRSWRSTQLHPLFSFWAAASQHRQARPPHRDDTPFSSWLGLLSCIHKPPRTVCDNPFIIRSGLALVILGLSVLSYRQEIRERRKGQKVADKANSGDDESGDPQIANVKAS